MYEGLFFLFETMQLNYYSLCLRVLLGSMNLQTMKRITLEESHPKYLRFSLCHHLSGTASIKSGTYLRLILNLNLLTPL